MRFFIFLSIILLSFQLTAQPTNDDCSGAIEIDFNDWHCIWADNYGATDSGFGDSDCGGDPSEDIWIKFTATDTLHQIGFSSGESGDDWVIDLIEGDCNSGVVVACKYYEGGTNETLNFDSFIIGQVYYLRAFDAAGNTPYSVQICVNTFTLPSEEEDDCLNAETLPVNDNIGDDGSYYNHLNVSQPTSVPADTCFSGPYYDLWYKFIATSTRHKVNVISTGGTNLLTKGPNETSILSGGDLAVGAFVGASCDALTFLTCANDNGVEENEYLDLQNLTIGQEVYIRVYSADILNLEITFNIYISTPPSNDFCENAIAITNTNGNCDFQVSGDTRGATGSGGCTGSADDDVWYRFTASSGAQLISLQSTGIYDPVIEVMTGDCNNLNSLHCLQGTALLSTDYVIGQEYFIRVYSNDSNSGNGTFKLCVSVPPANLSCSTSTPVPVNEDQSCTLVLDDNNYGIGLLYSWYSFIATKEKQIITVNSSLSPNDSIYNSSCVAISKLEYTFYNGGPRMILRNLVPGQQYKFALKRGYYGEGEYQICIKEPVVNDDCTGAYSVDVNTDCTCTIFINGSCINATSEGVVGSCTSNDNKKTVWYKFIPTNPKATVTISPIGDGYFYGDIVGPNNCEGPSLLCFSASGSLSNLEVGEEYYIRVVSYTYSEEPEDNDFNLCIQNHSNDYCSSPVVLIPAVNCNSVSSTTIGAAYSGVNSYCASHGNPDVWFEFTAALTTQRITVNPLTAGFDPVISLYRKNTGTPTCDLNCTLSSVSCVDVTFSDFDPEILVASGLTIGNKYLIAISNSNNSVNSGDFNICVSKNSSDMEVINTTAETYGPLTVPAGTWRRAIKKLKINLLGTTAPLNVSQIKINLSGTTDASSILSASIFYSRNQGSDPNFDPIPSSGSSNPILFGPTIENPTGTLVFNGSQSFSGTGTDIYARYFFVVFDVACNSNVDDLLNAEIESIVIGTTTYYPVETSNEDIEITEFQKYHTKANGDWSQNGTWLCGSPPPNSANNEPVVLNHNVTVSDSKTTGSITVRYLRTLTVSPTGILTLGGSSMGDLVGNSNKFLSASYGSLSVNEGTLNVNGAISVGNHSGNTQIGVFSLTNNGTINIDGNDGTNASASSGIYIGTSNMIDNGGGNINILDPSQNGGFAFDYDAWNNNDFYKAWDITLGGGDDTGVSGSYGGYIVKATGPPAEYGFSFLKLKTIHIKGGYYTEGRQSSTYNYLIAAHDIIIDANAEHVGALGFSGNLVNNGLYTSEFSSNGGLYLGGDFKWSSFTINSGLQSISGSGFFRRNLSDPIPTDQNENKIKQLSSYNSNPMGVLLGVPLTVIKSLMIKSGKINTTATNLLTLGEPGLAGDLCLNNLAVFEVTNVEYTGPFESWTGGYVNGPFKRYFSGSTASSKTILPVGKGTSKQIMGIEFENTSSGYVTAEYQPIDPGTSCLPMVEQGISITNTASTGLWKLGLTDLSGNYKTMVNALGFQKRGGGALSPLSDLRLLQRKSSEGWIPTTSTTNIGPTNLNKVAIEGLVAQEGEFVLGIGGGNTSAGDSIEATNFYLTADININGDLDFNAPDQTLFPCWNGGIFILGPYNLTVNGQVINYDSDRYVVTNGTGKLKINNNLPKNIFPVARSLGNQVLLELNNLGDQDNFSVSILPYVRKYGESGNDVTSNNLNLTWLIEEDVAGGTDATLTFYWEAENELPGFDRSSASIAHYNTELDKWELSSPQSAILDTNGYYSISEMGYSSFSPFTVTNSISSPLPLELISFTGRKNGDENVLTFMTTKGKNVKGFDIQRSEDGRNFGTIGTLAISTACEALCKYGYVDRQPVKGFNYYRIKILDKDNSYAYSNIVSILNGGQTEFLLSPNPVSDYISIPEDALLSKFTLLNANGQFIKGGKIETYKLNVSDLPGGFYFLIIESKDINSRYRFVKM